MINYLLILLLFVSPFNDNKSNSWSSQELKAANTAKDADYMTNEEKTIIQYLNLARMYPQRYLEIGIAQNKINKKGSKYHKSLVKHLSTMTPIGPLQPSEKMFELANCLAKEQSKSGKIGHKRKRCKEDYLAECCSYSYDGPEYHVLVLLIDEDVPSLGHREIILDGSYTYAGAAMRSHKEYGKVTVIDFE